MKCVFVQLCCLLAVVSAGYAAPTAGYAFNHGFSHAAPVAHAYAQAGHVAHGAPLPVQDTYEVAAAKAEHFKAYAIAKELAAKAGPDTDDYSHGYAHGGPASHGYAHSGPVSHGYAHAGPVSHGYAHAAPVAYNSYSGSHSSVAGAAPLPVQDTHEVAAAKAEHFRAHAAVRGQGAHASPFTHGFSSAVAHEYTHSSPVSHGYAHAAPVSHGYAHAAPVSHGYAHGGHYGGEARLVDPVAIAAGAPLPVADTHEVAAAKAAHLQAHAAARNGHLGLY